MIDLNEIKTKLEQLGYFVSVKRENKWLQIETKDTSYLEEYVDDSPYKSIPIKDFNPFYIEKVKSNIKLTYFPEGMLTYNKEFDNVDELVEFITIEIPLE